MRRIGRILMALLVVSTFAITSCVKNEVSPMVEELRAQELETAKAATAWKAADAKLKEAAVVAAEMLNTQNVARNEAELVYLMAEANARLETAKKDLKAAELLLQMEVDKLAEYMREHNLDEALTYLGLYQAQMAIVNTKSNTKLDKVGQLAMNQMLLASEVDVDAAALIGLNNDVVRAEADLAADKATLETLKDVASGNATLEGTINAEKLKVATYKSERNALQVEEDAANTTLVANAATLTATVAVINDFETEDLAGAIEGNTTVIAALKVSIPALKAELTTLEGQLTTAEANLAPFVTSMEVKEAAIATKENEKEAAQQAYDQALIAWTPLNTAYNTAKSDSTTAQNDYDSKLVIKVAAQDAWEAAGSPDPSPLLDALNDAKAELAIAKTELDAKNAAAAAARTAWLPKEATRKSTLETLGDKTDELNQLNTDKALIQLQLNSAENVVTGLEGDITAKELAIENAEDALVVAERALANDTVKLGLDKPDYDAAVAARTAQTVAVTEAQAAKDAFAGQIALKTAMIGASEAVIALLEGDVTDMEGILEGAEDAVDGSEVALATAKKAVSTYVDGSGQAALETLINNLTSDIAQLTADIAVAQQLADKYMELINGLLG